MQPIRGLHHITAVAGDAQTNVDFYRQVLGQRMVKTTVNFDDPGTYHLYYGDAVGSPGTLLTFFPWRGVKPGRLGNGETAAVAYTIPAASVGFWQQHLARMGVDAVIAPDRFGVDVLSFADPDGMRLELVPVADVNAGAAALHHWDVGPIPEAHALRGFYGVTLWLDRIAPTAERLTAQMGYTLAGEQGNRTRYQGDADAVGPVVDILHRPGEPQGSFGAGSIHHIAFRVPDDAAQEARLARLREAGQRVTDVVDRQYFRSIYFRTPGGVLFEIATDPPGMLIDEPVETLGEALKLPPWYEPRRAEIEAVLPPLSRPALTVVEGGSD